MLVSVVGVLGLVIGGVYLFGGFDEKPVYAQDLFFNNEEMLSSGTFALQVNTATEDVNKRALVLETSGGGDTIIEYPRSITLGESFRIAPKKISASSNTNVGGYVLLHAKYAGATSNQTVVATCKILIDVKVEEVSVWMPKKIVEPNGNIQIASAGDSLSTLLNIHPLYPSSLMPYSSRDVFGTVPASSKFSPTNLTNKKIFLEVFASDTNPDKEAVSFAVGSLSDNSLLTEVEVEYEFDPISNGFVFTKDLFIKASNAAQPGEVCLKAYYYPTYNDQKTMTPTNFRETATSTLASQEAFNVIRYSVDSLSMEVTEKTIYLNEDSLLYINNPANPQSNLGITLGNSNNNEIEQTVYRNSLYISVESQNISYILTKSNDDATKNAFGLNAYVEGVNEMSQWCWKFKLTDFLAYYNYASSPTNSNKLTMKVEYNDGSDNLLSKTFYIVPAIHKVNTLSVKYPSASDTAFYAKSGLSFQLSESNFEYGYTTPPTFTDLAYYIPYDTYNQISTIPTILGTYDVQFDFTISVDSSLRFSIFNEWCAIHSSNVVFTQGSKTFSIAYSIGGVPTPSTFEVEFEANKTISCQIEKLSMLKAITMDDTLFTVSFGNNNTNILAKNIKFYRENSRIPILAINDVSYAVNFDYFDDGHDRYIHIIAANSTYVLSGIGSFTIVAQLVYTDTKTGTIYWLDKSADLSVYAYTDLTNLYVKHIDPNTLISTYFDRSGTQYDENESLPDAANHFFISCEEDQLGALKKNKETGKLKIQFAQNFGDLNTAPYENAVGLTLSDINSAAITFGTWQEVIIDGEFAGYYISYYINEVYSIFINDDFLNNFFDIIIFIENDSGENIYANFAFDAESFQDYISIEIEDAFLETANLIYPSVSGGNNPNNPIELRAYVTGTSFGWNVGGSNFQTDIPVQYSFKYKGSETTTTSHMSEELLFVGGEQVSNVSAFHTFNLAAGNQGNGGLSFKNFPFSTQGTVVQLRIFSADAQSNATTHYSWEPGGFVRKINQGLADGSSLYFKIIGLDLDIRALNPSELDGYEGNIFPLFSGTNAIFSINNELKDLTDFSSIFQVNATSPYVQVDKTRYAQLTVTNDFLFEDDILLSLVYANGDEISFKNPSGSNDITLYPQRVKGAFEIDPGEEFSAPSTASFYEIKYKKNNTDAISGNMITAILTKVDSEENALANNSFTIFGNKLSFKSITGTLTTTLRLTLSLVGTDLTTSKDYSITINSIYAPSDLSVGTLEEDGDFSGKYSMVAGMENQITITSGHISLSGQLLASQGNISNISLAFADNEDSPVSASLHMKALSYSSGPNIGFYSTDINFDKIVFVTFTFTFTDGGTFFETKEVVVKQNLEIEMHGMDFDKSSGALISFGHDIFKIKRLIGGSVVETYIPDTDFMDDPAKYNTSSFTYDELYFDDVTSMQPQPVGNVIILKVRSSREGELPPASGVQTIITFEYKPTADYSLIFSYTFTLNITEKT